MSLKFIVMTAEEFIENIREF